MIELLSHRDPECTGSWILRGTKPENRVIRCRVCGQEYPGTADDPQNRLAAIDENYAGIYLKRLAAEGADMLLDEHPVVLKPRWNQSNSDHF